MNSDLINFFSSNSVIALLSAVTIFLITIVLVAKHWIGFPLAFILLLLSIIVGILINNPNFFTNYAELNSNSHLVDQQNEFKKSILEALDDVKLEIKNEHENVNQLKKQLENAIEHADKQEQKLEQFIKNSHQHQHQASKDINTGVKNEVENEIDTNKDANTIDGVNEIDPAQTDDIQKVQPSNETETTI